MQIGGPAKAAGKSEEVIYPIRQDWEGRPSAAASAADRFAHLLNPAAPSYSITCCLYICPVQMTMYYLKTEQLMSTVSLTLEHDSQAVRLLLRL